MSLHSAPLFRFGVVADPQYADIPANPATGRYYPGSLAKLAEAVAVFNAEELAFVVTLGDIIDRDWRSYDDILPVYERLRHRHHVVLGNHDFAVAPQHLADVPARLGMASSYGDFAHGGHRFVLLDGNDVSLFAPPPGDPRRELAQARLSALTATGAVNAQTWNGTLGETQFDWLAAVMDQARAAGETVIVMNHYPVFPANAHNLWDAERLVTLLTGYDNFAAYFCGHNHVGNLGSVAGCPFVTFKGMVDTENDNAFAIVEVHGDRLQIRGFGREDSRSLPLDRRPGATAP